MFGRKRPIHMVLGGARDIKNFVMALIGLWLVSIIRNWFSFLSLLYICFVLIHTVPMLYENYEDEIDPISEKAVIEMKKHYHVFEDKVLTCSIWMAVYSLETFAKLHQPSYTLLVESAGAMPLAMLLSNILTSAKRNHDFV